MRCNPSHTSDLLLRRLTSKTNCSWHSHCTGDRNSSSGICIASVQPIQTQPSRRWSGSLSENRRAMVISVWWCSDMSSKSSPMLKHQIENRRRRWETSCKFRWDSWRVLKEKKSVRYEVVNVVAKNDLDERTFYHAPKSHIGHVWFVQTHEEGHDFDDKKRNENQSCKFLEC